MGMTSAFSALPQQENSDGASSMDTRDKTNSKLMPFKEVAAEKVGREDSEKPPCTEGVWATTQDLRGAPDQLEHEPDFRALIPGGLSHVGPSQGPEGSSPLTLRGLTFRGSPRLDIFRPTALSLNVNPQVLPLGSQHSPYLGPGHPSLGLSLSLGEAGESGDRGCNGRRGPTPGQLSTWRAHHPPPAATGSVLQVGAAASGLWWCADATLHHLQHVHDMAPHVHPALRLGPPHHHAPAGLPDPLRLPSPAPTPAPRFNMNINMPTYLPFSFVSPWSSKPASLLAGDGLLAGRPASESPELRDLLVASTSAEDANFRINNGGGAKFRIGNEGSDVAGSGLVTMATDSGVQDEWKADESKLRELEQFAANFKSRRIKLGYTQTNVGR